MQVQKIHEILIAHRSSLNITLPHISMVNALNSQNLISKFSTLFRMIAALFSKLLQEMIVFCNFKL
jgi:hypothetical protein